MFRKLWRPGIGGVTHWKWIFVDPRLMRGDRKQLARLVIHELVHVRQFEQLGYLTFLTRYIWDYLIGRWGGKDRRQAYMDIAAEAEARDMVSKIIDII